MKLNGRICRMSLCVFVWGSLAAAQQPPAPQTPASPPAPATASPKPQPPVAQPQEPENIEKMLSIGAYVWLPSGGPSLRGGVNPTDTNSHDLTLPKRPRRAYGVMLTFPTKGNTRLEFSYLTLSGAGNVTAPRDLGFFGGTVPQGEPLAVNYSIRHLKMSWNYLTYPNPPQDSKFRIKTLWEVQFLQAYPTVVETVTAPDLPLGATQRVILPTVGLGVEYVPSKRFRMELRGSGMQIPKHSGIGDAEGNAVVRVGSLEIFAGGKVLYFRTSPQQETYIKGLLWGPQGGIRWVFH